MQKPTRTDRSNTQRPKIPPGTDLSGVIEIMNQWCEADGDHQDFIAECMEFIKDCMEQLKLNTQAITGIDAAPIQVGCTKDADGNITGHVVVMKYSDTTQTPPVETCKRIWFSAVDGTKIDPFEGPYEDCNDFREILDVLSDILKCPKPFNMECVQKFTRCVGYDNGVTPGSSVNDGGLRDNFISFAWAFKVKSWFVNGADIATPGTPFGPFSGWTPQLQGWADYFNETMPETAKCKAEFGFLPAPTWRYTKITCNDPDTSFGPLMLEREDGVCFTVFPQFENTVIERRYRYSTLDCEGEKITVWCDANGKEVEAPQDPECWYSCAVRSAPIISGPAGPQCSAISFRRVCDKQKEGDDVPFYIVEYICDGKPVIEFYTAESWEAGNPEAYEITGDVVDCITGEAVDVPCDPQIKWETHYGYICDRGDSRFGEMVCWIQGIFCGKPVFEDGKTCPTFYPGKLDTRIELAGKCNALSLGSAISGLVPDRYAPSGAGTNTHSIKFSQNGAGNGLSNAMVADTNGSFTLCKITAGDAVFVYDTRTLTVTGGTPGDGNSIAFTTEYQNDVEGCQDEYDAIWNESTDASVENAGYARNCTRLTFTAAGEPVGADCTKALEVQPTQVSKENPIAIDGAHAAYFKNPVERTIDYSVGDFDSGDLEAGDTASTQVEFNVPSGCTLLYLTSDEPVTFVPGTAAGTFTASWVYDGLTNAPKFPVKALIECAGDVQEFTGGDFFIASGGGGEETLTFMERVTLKEFCVKGQASVFQDDAGNTIDVSKMQRCTEQEAIAGLCDDFVVDTLYSISGITDDLRSREWELGPRSPALLNEADGQAIVDAFDFLAPTTVDALWPNLSVNDTNNASDVQDVQVVEGFLVVENPIPVRWNGGSAGYFALDIGKCCGDLEQVIKGARGDDTANPTPEYLLPLGIHKIRLWNVDDYSNTNRNANYSPDGGMTWISSNTPPGVRFSRTKPVETCKKVKICKATGKLFDLLTGEPIDPKNCYSCSMACSASSGAPGVWAGC